MRFALLGTGAEAMHLAEAVERDADHQLSAVADAASELTIGETPAVTWESLLNPEVAEAIIVGQTDDPDRRAKQLRQLVQASVPMILVHPACEAIVGYELDMIRRDTECVMVPYFSGLAHPVFDLLRQLVSQAPETPIGKVEQLQVERQMAERGRETVLQQLAQDAFLIRQILGNVTQLTALGPKSGQTDYGNLNVHLSSPEGVPARWAINITDQQPAARISLLGQMDRATVELDENGGMRTWRIPGVSPSDEPVLSWGGPASAIDCLVKGGSGREAQLTWDDACRAADLADTVDVSLRRGRTIDVYTQPCTEEDTFKGVMAIGGCGALLLTLLVVLVLAIVESFDITLLDHPFWQQYPWRILYWRNWPYYLLGLLTLFLSLQLFRFLYPNSNRPD